MTSSDSSSCSARRRRSIDIPESDVVVRLPAKPHPDGDPPAREAVERRDLAGELPGPPARQRVTIAPTRSRSVRGAIAVSTSKSTTGRAALSSARIEVPDEEAVPAGRLGVGGQVGEQARVAPLAVRGDVEPEADRGRRPDDAPPPRRRVAAAWRSLDGRT